LVLEEVLNQRLKLLLVLRM
jgi:hypothetical protein